MVPAIFVHWAPDLVEAAEVRLGGRALDVARGTGAVTKLLAARVGPAGTVVGLDINPWMLAVALLAAPPPYIEWLEGSAVSITLPDATFDHVLCEQGLQFFPDKPAALAEMRRVLKPGTASAVLLVLCRAHAGVPRAGTSAGQAHRSRAGGAPPIQPR